jgi:hypothetical protein
MNNKNVKKIDYTIILIIILIIIFFIIFFYSLVYNNNNFVKFRVIKNPIEKIPDSEINYDELKNKYTFKKCSDMCNENICDDYQIQVIKYDLCKECKKENKCYNQYKGICVECNGNNYTCEELFGCINKPPINPLQNYCVKCWN